MQLTMAKPTVGDGMRFFELSAHTDEKISTVAMAGKITVMVFQGFEAAPASEALLLAMKNVYPDLTSRKANLFAISMSQPPLQKEFAEKNKIPFPILNDHELQVSALYGALRPKDKNDGTSAPPKEQETLELDAIRRVILFGPDRRVLKIYDHPDASTIGAQLLADIDSLLLSEPPQRFHNHAPVLLIPNVLPLELRQRLMQVWEQENGDSGFMRQVNGKTVGMYDYSHKIRRDHYMNPGPDLDHVKRYIAARVIPTLQTAFNYEATRFEDFRIACYDAARGGYFRPHRDNTTDGTAHRRFAMSLLLNDDYGGGSLRFPEYGLNEYRPEAGSAIIFSCSLLHEATDVTSGRRFVLLSFLYGEKEAKIREDYNLRTGGQYRSVQ